MKDSGLPTLDKLVKLSKRNKSEALESLKKWGEEMQARRDKRRKQVIEKLQENKTPLLALLEGWEWFKEEDPWEKPTFEDYVSWLRRELE